MRNFQKPTIYLGFILNTAHYRTLLCYRVLFETDKKQNKISLKLLVMEVSFKIKLLEKRATLQS